MFVPLAACDTAVSSDGAPGGDVAGGGPEQIPAAPELVLQESNHNVFFERGGTQLVVHRADGVVTEEGALGQVITRFGSYGTGAAQLNGPTSAVLGTDGRVYVMDRGNNRIQVFERGGAHAGQIGRAGTQPGELMAPAALFQDAQGRLVVADTFNHRVQIFAQDGRTLAVLGQGVDGMPGVLNAPVAVSVAKDGSVHVLDSAGGGVTVFNTDGSVQRTYGNDVIAGRALRMPSAMVMGADGLTYVADPNNATVRVFHSARGTFIRQQPTVESGVAIAALHLAFAPSGALHVAGMKTRV